MSIITRTSGIGKYEITMEIPLPKQPNPESFTHEDGWLSTALNHIGYAAMVTEGDGRVMFMNALAESLTGWKFEQARGNPLTKIRL